MNEERTMLSRNLLAYVGLVLISGSALAGAGGDLSNPSTTGNQAMEQPTTDLRDAESGDRSGVNSRTGEAGEESGVGTMGAGASDTTGGMGATTGSDTIGDRDEETDQ
jgi:hypothetical protein